MAVALDASQQRCVARPANAWEGTKSKELFEYDRPGVTIGRVAPIAHQRGKRVETMVWPRPGEKPAIERTILEDDTEAKRAAEL
jgi:hypothetical protein